MEKTAHRRIAHAKKLGSALSGVVWSGVAVGCLTDELLYRICIHMQKVQSTQNGSHLVAWIDL